MHISLIWSWGTTYLQHSLYPSWNWLCKFWIVSSGILYHASSSRLRDNRGNLLLTLLSKTDLSGSLIFKLGKCASQRCWSAAYSWSSNKDRTLLAVCMGESSSWKIPSLLGCNTWTIGCTVLPKMSMKSLVLIWPFWVSTGAAEY